MKLPVDEPQQFCFLTSYFKISEHLSKDSKMRVKINQLTKQRNKEERDQGEDTKSNQNNDRLLGGGVLSRK